MSMTSFTVDRTERLEIQCISPLAEMYKLSPFVWHENDRYELLLRAVNRSDDPEAKVSRIYSGLSRDGLHFAMGEHPVIEPGPGEEDRDGCEDPTVAVVDNTLHVYYSGWAQARNEGQLLLAAGEDSQHRLQLSCDGRGVTIQGQCDDRTRGARGAGRMLGVGGPYCMGSVC